MKRRHYVAGKNGRQAPPVAPKEIIEVGPRAYRDRWGTEYDVVWAGLKSDFSLLGDYDRAASS